MCNAPGNPGVDGMTHDMQITAMDMANYYRNLVATGWAQDKKDYAPPAKNMNALEYDCDTAGVGAKVEAAKCTAASYTPTPGYVLSSYKAKLDIPRVEVLRKAMAFWFGQLKSVDLDDKASYNNDVDASAKDFANVGNVYSISDDTNDSLFYSWCMGTPQRWDAPWNNVRNKGSRLQYVSLTALLLMMIRFTQLVKHAQPVLTEGAAMMVFLDYVDNVEPSPYAYLNKVDAWKTS
ncbi:hypothetical protein Y032_0048g1585 [Ancylostoma ceylanicum]|nr:hypothetical protein Y032_0048g1585 [Ancylostoma ceylanicum]